MPAAYEVVLNFMSNHSEEHPAGCVPIPEGLYKRPTISPYNLAGGFVDVGIGYFSYQKTLKIGKHRKGQLIHWCRCLRPHWRCTKNSKNLFEDDNFACFAFVLLQQAIPDFLKRPLADINNATPFLAPSLSPLLSKLIWPEFSKYDQSLFNDLPGYKYRPRGPATNSDRLRLSLEVSI
ncbi:uncharacterized protein N7529_001049 [Penicillium soppii]|uniref:uncharacterized protein n=1 Tax=Penicillium soppii TaxID=69789 RepID=UPI0025485E0F|nr:uncharacterized protein N7529_001049 [Penicillium soppii]KAJ5882377.1 hypothetical protein N7529_001049 [Penicillium soppii]